MANSVTPVNNYLVPATGTTNSVPVVGNFTATPTRQDFREISLNGEQFVPSGVFIDNSAGAGPLTISIEGMSGFSVQCPAGSRMGRQYPAPIDQIVNITGNGQAIVIFTDFPVLPYDDFGATSGSAVTIADGADVAFGAQADAPATNDTGAFSIVSLFKRLLGKFNSPSTGTTTNVVAAVADTLMLASNVGRQGTVIFNDSTAGILYLRCATGAATVLNYTAVIQPGGSLILGNRDYTGEIRGIWSAATGFARVTEFTV